MGKNRSRRSFLVKCAALAGAIALPTGWYAWKKPRVSPPVAGRVMGSTSSVGHMLRGAINQAPSETIRCEYVIVGSGVAGLSAARWLHNNQVDSFCLMELEASAGGNATSGSNTVSAYPWGAHYLPVPDASQTDLIQFLEEKGVIVGYNENSIPIYNEYYLCFDPKERLFIHGYWQEGLIPHFGVPDADRQQIKRFLDVMQEYRTARGTDGKQAFALPVDQSSQDTAYIELDTITMQAFMATKGFTSPYLLWYVDYCCRDDYGTTIHDTSAWAGIHYFAARKGTAANAEAGSVLTWPEGNAWLTKQLQTHLTNHIRVGCLAYDISVKGESVQVDYYDTQSKSTKRIIANKCIMACPQFINHRIVKGIPWRDEVFYSQFSYSPWMVANITVNRLAQSRGAELCWDNVLYQSESLGYVNANHQRLESRAGKRVITYYRPLADQAPPLARKEALEKSHSDWTTLVINELARVHQGIAEEIENVDVWVWGHGMIRPTPGFIWSEARKSAAKPYQDKIFFAHSDVGGVSLFEEAFAQGIRAAKEALH